MKSIRQLMPAILFAILAAGLMALPAGSTGMTAFPARGWVQANDSGFGDTRSISVSTLHEYKGQLYAGTYNWTVGGSVWRYSGGKNWQQVAMPGVISSPLNPAITSMLVFQDHLYAATGWGTNLAQVWRFDGTTWVKVLEAPLNGFTALAVFKDQIYVGASVGAESGIGAQILRSDSGDLNSWTTVVSAGNGDVTSYGITNLVVFNSHVYAAVANDVKGVQVWRSDSGDLDTWSVVMGNGFGSSLNSDPGSFTVYNDHLYLGVRNGPIFITQPAQSGGGQLYRTQDGNTWTPVTLNGFGDPQNVKIEGMIAHQQVLYAFTSNPFHGMEVWASEDSGATWKLNHGGGFSSPYNRNTLWNSALVVFEDTLFVGTSNYDPETYQPREGGQVWQQIPLNHSVYLPAISK
jgi:hypothetical protein